MKTLCALAAVTVSFGLFLCASPSKAAPIVRQAVVHYGDLNLSRDAGVHALMGRIEQAASRTCGGKPALHDFRAWAAYRACVDAALNKAVSDINHPMVDKLYGRQRRMAGN